MTNRDLMVKVECHSGYRGEESPKRFFLGERSVEVLDIIDRWLDPEHRYFKVRADDEGVYILRHDTKSGDWELTLFNSGHHDQGKLSST